MADFSPFVIDAARNKSDGMAGAQNASAKGPGGPSRDNAKSPLLKDTGMLLVLNDISILWGSLVAAAILYNVIAVINRKTRLAICSNDDRQHYFNRPNRLIGALKRDLIHAPLFRLRHNREFKLNRFPNVDFGTVPGRLPTLILLGYLVANVAFHIIAVDWDVSFDQVWADIRNRSGQLSTINMIPLFLFAGRNNLLIRWCDISFDTFNLFHRWIGRLAVVEAIVHVIAWIVPRLVDGEGLEDRNRFLIVAGTIAFIPFLFIFFHSPALLRHAWYEFFLYSHIVAAAVAIGGLWLHVLRWPLMGRVVIVAIVFWVFDRLARFARVLYANVGLHGISKATVEIIPGDAIRVTVFPVRPWRFHTGQHIYVYMPRSGWWTSHPFSISWNDDRGDTSSEKGLDNSKKSVSLIIRRRTGFTDKLFKQVEKSTTKYTTSCLVEGAYGLQESFRSYGTVLLFAAGVGIAHQLPHVRDLVEHYDSGIATRRVTLIWYIQSTEHIEWIQDWIASILAVPRCSEVLRIQIYVTKPSKELQPQSVECMEVLSGRPDMDVLFESELKSSVGAVAVATCGVGGLADEVRRAARMRMLTLNLDLFEEAFTW